MTALTDSTATSEPTETFGSRLRHLMEEKGFNQTSLAVKMGMDRTDLNRTVNDKRQPKKEEIGWIATVLGMTVEELLDGVDLPDDLKKGVERIEEMALRVLDAERSREEATARVGALEAELEAVRQTCEQERESLEERIQEERARAQSQLEAVRREAEQAQQALRHQLDTSRRSESDLRVRVQGLEAAKAKLLRQVRALQNELKKQKGKTAAAAILSGLAGIGVGAIASSDD